MAKSKQSIESETHYENGRKRRTAKTDRQKQIEKAYVRLRKAGTKFLEYAPSPDSETSEFVSLCMGISEFMKRFDDVVKEVEVDEFGLPIE